MKASILSRPLRMWRFCQSLVRESNEWEVRQKSRWYTLRAPWVSNANASSSFVNQMCERFIHSPNVITITSSSIFSDLKVSRYQTIQIGLCIVKFLQFSDRLLFPYLVEWLPFQRHNHPLLCFASEGDKFDRLMSWGVYTSSYAFKAKVWCSISCQKCWCCNCDLHLPVI